MIPHSKKGNSTDINDNGVRKVKDTSTDRNVIILSKHNTNKLRTERIKKNKLQNSLIRNLINKANANKTPTTFNLPTFSADSTNMHATSANISSSELSFFDDLNEIPEEHNILTTKHVNNKRKNNSHTSINAKNSFVTDTKNNTKRMRAERIKKNKLQNSMIRNIINKANTNNTPTISNLPTTSADSTNLPTTSTNTNSTDLPLFNDLYEIPLENNNLTSEQLNNKRKKNCHQSLYAKKRINSLVNFDENNFPENYLGPMDIVCKYCSAKHFKNEANSTGTFANCCQNGKVVLEKLQEAPDLIKTLLNTDKDFLDNIR